MGMGRTSEARAYARRFIAANPASPLAERMRRPGERRDRA